MEAKEIYSLAGTLTPEELLDLMKAFINSGKGHSLEDAVIKRLPNWHHTLQQCLMRSFIVPAVATLAKEEYPDDRNRATVTTCQKVARSMTDPAYPFI